MAHRRDNQKATMRATSSHVQPSPRITCAQQRPISIATRHPVPPKHQRNDCAGQGQHTIWKRCIDQIRKPGSDTTVDVATVDPDHASRSKSILNTLGDGFGSGPTGPGPTDEHSVHPHHRDFIVTPITDQIGRIDSVSKTEYYDLKNHFSEPQCKMTVLPLNVGKSRFDPCYSGLAHWIMARASSNIAP
ncbi:hypothetical protein F511_09793 [Dorcoceras hygrometricum]|uniref:Uncharacterized protein n=1 Tax=Dorcoceras hygrometricum TaxID=472368 RepID=A0A2Z7BTU5_9LAMI|nr:hypothetical protein F511_09793 [Dorcoceras hygrometricum]